VRKQVQRSVRHKVILIVRSSLFYFASVDFSWVDDVYSDFKPPPDASEWATSESWSESQAQDGEKIDFEDEYISDVSDCNL
jgi:hypothetical protein